MSPYLSSLRGQRDPGDPLRKRERSVSSGNLGGGNLARYQEGRVLSRAY